MFIAAAKHLLSRQARHWLRWVLSMGHLPLRSPEALQVYTLLRWMLRLKNPEHPANRHHGVKGCRGNFPLLLYFVNMIRSQRTKILFTISCEKVFLRFTFHEKWQLIKQIPNMKFSFCEIWLHTYKHIISMQFIKYNEIKILWRLRW